MDDAEALANTAFKKDRDGNTVFFPWGILGRGRVPPSSAEEAAARQYMVNTRTNGRIMMWVCIGVTAFGWEWAALLVLIFSAWYVALLMSLISGWPYHTDRFSITHAYSEMAAGFSRRKIKWYLGISVVMLPLGLYSLFTSAWLSGLTVVVICVGGIVVYSRMLRIKPQ